MKKQEFMYLEVEMDESKLDCDICNEINDNVKNIYENCEYKILDFKTNIVNSKQRGLTDSYPILCITMLIEYKELED